MATRIYCDVCGEHIPSEDPVYCLAVSQPRSGSMNLPVSAAGTRDAVCHACATRALAAPPRPDPSAAVHRVIGTPVADLLEGLRDPAGAALTASELNTIARRVAEVVAERVDEVRKAVWS